MDFLPRPAKMLLYGLAFVLVLMGGASAIGWFTLLALGIVFYAVFRLVAMDCNACENIKDLLG